MSLNSRFTWPFRNRIKFLWYWIISMSPNPPSWRTIQLGWLSATAYWIFSPLPTTSGRRSSIINLMTSHAVLTRTHSSWATPADIYKLTTRSKAFQKLRAFQLVNLLAYYKTPTLIRVFAHVHHESLSRPTHRNTEHKVLLKGFSTVLCIALGVGTPCPAHVICTLSQRMTGVVRSILSSCNLCSCEWIWTLVSYMCAL